MMNVDLMELSQGKLVPLRLGGETVSSHVLNIKSKSWHFKMITEHS